MGGSDEPGDQGRRRVLLRDVARAAGVSEAQTSAALSGYPGVSEATRLRVRAVADDLGYQPNQHARRLGSRRRADARCVVVLNKPKRDRVSAAAAEDPPHDDHALSPFVGRMVEGILTRASEIGIDVRLVQWPELQTEVTKLAAQDAADAVLVPAFTGLTRTDVTALHATGLPFVLLNRHFHDDPVAPAVVADVGAGVIEAVDRLVAGGHRRLALMVEQLESSVVADYLDGWRSAVRRHGVAESSVLAQVDHADPAAREAAVVGMLDAPEPPTAIIAVSEIAAHGVLRAAAARDLQIPRDLSVITFESVIAPYTSPALSGFDLHLAELGARAVDRVAIRLGLVQGEAIDGTERLSPRYLERDSTGPVRPRSGRG